MREAGCNLMAKDMCLIFQINNSKSFENVLTHLMTTDQVLSGLKSLRIL